MKRIVTLFELKNELSTNNNVWLLLYKKGSSQSNCAFNNFVKAKAPENNVLCHADVNFVRDIHPVYNITTVPSLLNFENGQLKNIVKGCYQPEQFNAIFEKVAFSAPGKANGKPQKNVTIFTAPTCTWCNTTKRYFQKIGIRYHEVDVSKDQKAAEEMVKRSGQQGVPQTDINGQIVVGFDKNKINSLLGIN